MIPIDPLRPAPVPLSPPLRVNKVIPVSAKYRQLENAAKDRRNKADRRKKPFVHRGKFEMRTGDDRRDMLHIDEEV